MQENILRASDISSRFWFSFIIIYAQDVNETKLYTPQLRIIQKQYKQRYNNIR